MKKVSKRIGIDFETFFILSNNTTCNWYLYIVPFELMKRKHRKTLETIYSRPVSGNIKWHDIEALFVELDAEISEREGSRIGVR